MDYKERRSHARGVYPTQDTSPVGTVRMNKARGRTRRKNNSNRVVRNLEEINAATIGKSPKQDLTSAKDLTTESPCYYYNNNL